MALNFLLALTGYVPGFAYIRQVPKLIDQVNVGVFINVFILFEVILIEGIFAFLTKFFKVLPIFFGSFISPPFGFFERKSLH
ncbi:MAG: hypothetical protein V1853_01235 [bacterium]